MKAASCRCPAALTQRWSPTLAPRAAVAVEQAYRLGYHERAAELQKALAGLARKTTSGGVGGLKYAMDQVGLYGFLPRSPLPAPTDDEKTDIDKAIEECGFFERSEDDTHWVEQTPSIHSDYAD